MTVCRNVIRQTLGNLDVEKSILDQMPIDLGDKLALRFATHKDTDDSSRRFYRR